MAFPTVQSVTESAESDNVTSHAVSLPATVDVNDLLLVIFSAHEGSSVSSTPSGWTAKWESANGGCLSYGAVRKADGSEDGGSVTITTDGSSSSAAHCYRITGWSEALADVEAGTPTTASNKNPDPPSLSSSYGTEDTLWIACGGAIDDDQNATAAPTDYTNLVSTLSGGGLNDGASTYSARRELNVSSEDPGTFTLKSSERWVANTIAVRPSGSATGRIEASWTELETPESPTSLEASFAEFELPELSATGRIEASWVEVETPESPTRLESSWTELEAPDPKGRFEVSWSELEAPDTVTRIETSWGEVEVPDKGAKSTVRTQCHPLMLIWEYL